MTSTTAAKSKTEKKPADPSVDGSAYEIIKARLDEQSKSLGERMGKLNARRLEVFGTTDLAVLSNERVRTENNCVPRDILNVAGKLWFGYNVFIGMKKEVKVEDVFALHHFSRSDDGTFNLDPIALTGDAPDPATEFLRDPQFVKDFSEIYRYYKEATLSQLRRTENGRLLAVFQVGATERDVKVLRWAINPHGVIRYIDNRGEEDHRFPSRHSFEWIRATRENYVAGRHPHVNILDEVFVETVGGDLTIKVENNTTHGRGIYSESVDDKNQSLDDAQFHYAKVGALILLKILPFRETAFRHLVFNTRTKEAVRIDAIEASCVELPEDHGIIFPGGYALATGEVKTFDVDGATGSVFKRVIKSDNGEDVLYVFYEPATGRRILLPYNLIDKEVRSPIVCHGWSLFDDGKVIAFRAEDKEPVRLHPMRIWQTPYLSPEKAAAQRSTSAHQGSLLLKTGNPEAVRAISDVQTVRRMIGSGKPTLRNYEDLIAAVVRILDAFPWLGEAEAQDLKSVLQEVHKTADLVIDEFEKVLQIQKASAEALAKSEEKQKQIFGDIRLDSFTSIDPFVELMTRLRGQRGHLITLKEERYIDVARLDVLEKECGARFDEVTGRAGRFLQGPEALLPYQQKHDDVMKRGDEATRAADCVSLVEELLSATQGLQLLTEVTGQLKIDDANARTAILEAIASMLGTLNRARAVLESKKKTLLLKEGASEFAAQMRLFASAVESALSLCDSPERTDQELSRLLVTVEELEGRFAGFDDFLLEIGKKREEVFEALSTKKQQLLDDRNRRAQNLLSSAERILDGVKRRALAMKTADELNAAFAADPMIEKARAIAAELLTLGDSMKSEEVLARLKATREDATRILRDKADIYVDGGDLIQLGQHRFAVNKQTFDLTMLPRTASDGSPRLALHLTGTEYFEDVDDAALNALRDLWDDTLPSEDSRVARVEFLACTILFDAMAGKAGAPGLEALEAARLEEGKLLSLVADVARSRYDEGYERGVHDADAARILQALLSLRREAGKLAHAGKARALSALWWSSVDDAAKASTAARVRGTARLLLRFQDSGAGRERVLALAAEMLPRLQALVPAAVVVDETDARAAAAAVVDEVGSAAGEPSIVLSGDAQLLCDELFAHLDRSSSSGADERAAFENDLKDLAAHPQEQLDLVLAWLRSVVDVAAAGTPVARAAPALLEAAVHLVTRNKLKRTSSATASAVVIDALFSAHPRIVDRKLEVRLDEVLPRVRSFVDVRVPRFLAMKDRRKAVIDERRTALRIAEFAPKVLASFVRNKLINEVYLPLVGNNLAKQMGAAGEKKRADLMGMLLLISPPGYGKTTLMEYVAQRLGLFYVKVNGPSIGHGVTSLDPTEAPDATSRQEVEKLNFAFELGNNVLLLIDDIQHTSPELLQKFISLCDGTRRVEGVWRGKTRTYDLRGKRFVVCMAGNPYTETGDKFQIPDMLANRADTYNLGDISGGREDVFALSYVENALTANPTTQPLAARDPADVHLLVRLAKGEPVATTDLKHGYSGAEIDELVRVFAKLLKVQSVLLKVNANYISSAATDERFRTEPPFKLQGSYRNMAKMAQGIVPVMNDDELERLIDDHYRGESQTLTTGSEANLLKLAELRKRASPEQQARWNDIRKNFERLQLQGDSNDPGSRVAATLANLTQRIEGIASSILEVSKVSALTAASEQSDRTSSSSSLSANLAAVQQELLALRKDTAAQEQLRHQQQTEQRALPPSSDPKLLAALEGVVTALAQAQMAITVNNPPAEGIADLVRMQSILIEASLLPLVRGLASSIEHEKDNAGRLEEALASLKALAERPVTVQTVQTVQTVGPPGAPMSAPLGEATTTTEVHRPFKPKPQGTRVKDK
ncbi:MAG: DNA repair ATPase [Deltaproteobacteria bacterium]|nr:DNA repair ATPase [Deltaproteobacteria bacterium]